MHDESPRIVGYGKGSVMIAKFKDLIA